MLLDALSYFIREQTQVLSEENARDEDWTRLKEYEGLYNDIVFYLLPQNK